jgi:FkbM family methyltransferase
MIIDKLFKLFLLVKTIQNFFTAFLDAFGLLHKDVLYKIRNKDLKFYARAGTQDMAEIVVVASGSEYDLYDIKSLLVNPIVVDIGGHIGTFSIPLAKMLKNKCKIFIFEPDKDNFDLLLRNIKLNKVNSIFPKNIAISDYVGGGFLKTQGINPDAYSLDKSRKDFNCKVSTLSEEMQLKKITKIDILKMDIEGGEYKIFSDKKSLNFILKNVHYFFMEYHNIDRHYNYSLIQKIIENNFRVINKHGVTLSLENLHWKENSIR